ncbi:MAG TPA: trehalose-6-phosphate synthase [Mycobacteriales bacterium]|nr:trehalose-6-phosphate synthase [Mycobacteriales bacterium]
MPAALVVASNRGPVAYSLGDDGVVHARRGGGGLVSAVGSLAADAGTVWVCAALGPGDRQAARTAPQGRLDTADTGGLAVRMLDIEETTFHRAYNAIANSTLWFVHHLLYDTPRRPAFDALFAREWQAYVDYNSAFADALAAEAAPGARVLIQDYHLSLAPRLLRERRADLAIAHFSHTPWAPPEYYELLPDEVGASVLLGILGADHAGFLGRRWADAFLACAARLPGVSVDGDSVVCAGHRTRIGVHALGVDGPALLARAAAPDAAARRDALLARTAGRQILLRIDRTELSKNIVRGLAAYRELLRLHPEWLGRVVHLVYAYPSRHDLPEYREYTADVQRLAQRIEDEFARPDWTPLVLEVSDDYPRSLAAYRIADVLVVNPIRDGMNLVAKEGPVLSDHGVALVLSRAAGAAEELADDALLVNPFDVSATAAAMDAALRMSAADRSERTGRLAAAATAMPPAAWLAAQIKALDDRGSA